MAKSQRPFVMDKLSSSVSHLYTSKNVPRIGLWLNRFLFIVLDK